MEKISFRYEDSHLPALKEISFEVEKGEKIAVVGPTGAGKTTLFYLLCGLYRPVSGVIKFNDLLISSENRNHKKLRRASGLVMQFPEKQIFESTIYDEIAFGPRNFEMTKIEIDKRVNESMQLVGLDFEKFAKKSPLKISMGEKRKVAIASILALNPEIILFDEPTSALDYNGFKEIENCINTLHENRITIFTITHDIELLESNFDRVLGFKNGDLLIDTKTSELFENKKVLKELDLET
ncbi:energy-coupling factor ABC transporter ATP-binding protein [candidate division KSB1 bacterium]